MSIKEFILIMISTIVSGVGMSLGLAGVIFFIWSIFGSDNPYRFFLALICVLAFFIGYGLYKFSIKYIYDEWGKYR